MERVKSKSDKRLIIEGQVNGKDACFLIDTGASVAIMDSCQERKYGLERGREFPNTIVGAGGEMDEVYYCRTMVDFYGKKIPQFLMADLRAVVKNVKRETGVEILGIISLPQMKMAGISLDCNDNLIILE